MKNLKEVIKNAKLTASRTAYDQIIIKDLTDNSYSFNRDYRKNDLWDNEVIVGEVKTAYVNGILQVKYINKEHKSKRI